MTTPRTVFRRAEPSDAARLALVGQATFLEAFAGILDGDDIARHCAGQHAAEVYERYLADAAVRIWIAEAERGGAPVGYLVVGPCTLPIADPGLGDLEIKRIYLLHRFQGTGVGSALMGAAIDEARIASKTRLLLGVYGDNRQAIAFYEKHGFRAVGRRRFLVGKNLYDDLILARPLEPPPRG